METKNSDTLYKGNTIDFVSGFERSLRFRPVITEDRSFLLDVYASHRKDELDLASWDDNNRQVFTEMQFNAQWKHYQEHFPEACHQIILLDQQPIGRIYIDRRKDEIRVLDISILEEFRNIGIGSRLMQGVLEEAQKTHKPVRLYVAQMNRAVGFYKRLGFTTIDDTGVHFFMEWIPDTLS